jgi:hypothetical protein
MESALPYLDCREWGGIFQREQSPLRPRSGGDRTPQNQKKPTYFAPLRLIDADNSPFIVRIAIEINVD